LVDERGQILQFRGQTGMFLEPAPGQASLDLLRMAKEGLGLELRALMKKARGGMKSVRKDGVRYLDDGRERRVNLEVLPLAGSAADPRRERFYVVLFEPVDGRGAARKPAARHERDTAG